MPAEGAQNAHRKPVMVVQLFSAIMVWRLYSAGRIRWAGFSASIQCADHFACAHPVQRR
jgi:hypothetical protein